MSVDSDSQQSWNGPCNKHLELGPERSQIKAESDDSSMPAAVIACWKKVSGGREERVMMAVQVRVHTVPRYPQYLDEHEHVHVHVCTCIATTANGSHNSLLKEIPFRL